MTASRRSVRDETFDVLRACALTTLFANPGSTEVPLLAGLPHDLRFVLALHEGSVVGAATGYALGRGEPALALLHTVAGLGNAVAALATARVNRAPLVVLVDVRIGITGLIVFFAWAFLFRPWQRRRLVAAAREGARWQLRPE